MEIQGRLVYTRPLGKVFKRLKTNEIARLLLGRAWASLTLAWLHCACVCIYLCLYACLDRPLTGNFKSAHLWKIIHARASGKFNSPSSSTTVELLRAREIAFSVRGKGYCQTAVSARKRPRAKMITTDQGGAMQFVSYTRAQSKGAAQGWAGRKGVTINLSGFLVSTNKCTIFNASSCCSCFLVVIMKAQ